MRILDCTLRDGANVVGLGFNEEMTKLMIEGLLEAGIELIELGNAHGMGAEEKDAPLTDREYLELLKPYRGKAEFGMFLQSKKAKPEVVNLASKQKLDFISVGSTAGDGTDSAAAVKMVKEAGLTCRYSQMKAYLLTPEALAEEALFLQNAGADEITIMDSAGTMTPEETGQYVRALKNKVSIPVGFHGHNNMGLSVANACAACESGADVVDTGLMGMARSAGNIPTEVFMAAHLRSHPDCGFKLYSLLNFIDRKLEPAMEAYQYHNPIHPMDLIMGYAGCHSGFRKLFASVAEEKQVPLYSLIARVSAIEKKAPEKELIEKIAGEMKEQAPSDFFRKRLSGE